MLTPLSLNQSWMAIPAVVRAGQPLRTITGTSELPHWLPRIEHVLEAAISAMSAGGFTDRFAGVTVDVVDNPQPNAIALKEDDRGLILLFSGLFDALCAETERAIRTPEFLQDYLATNLTGIDAVADLEQANLSEGELHPRWAWGLSFFSRTIDFVLHHELAHLTRDHHALQRVGGESTAQRVLDEAEAAAGDGRLISIRQLMELDADAVALDLMMIEANAVMPVSEWSVDQAEDEFFNTLLAVLVVCQVLDRAHQPMSAYVDGSHPAPVLRAVQFGKVLRYTYEHVFAIPPDRLVDLHDQAWWEASRLAEAAGRPPGRWHGADMNDVPDELASRIETGLRDFAARLKKVLGDI